MLVHGWCDTYSHLIFEIENELMRNILCSVSSMGRKMNPPPARTHAETYRCYVTACYWLLPWVCARMLMCVCVIRLELSHWIMKYCSGLCRFRVLHRKIELLWNVEWNDRIGIVKGGILSQAREELVFSFKCHSTANWIQSVLITAYQFTCSAYHHYLFWIKVNFEHRLNIIAVS